MKHSNTGAALVVGLMFGLVAGFVLHAWAYSCVLYHELPGVQYFEDFFMPSPC